MIAPEKSVEALISSFENDKLLYTLVEDERIYSNKDFPLKNVNPALIDQVFEKVENKFLGMKSPNVIVTQCEKLPLKPQTPKSFKGKEQMKREDKPKVSQPKVNQKHSHNKKKKDVKFVVSQGTDKIETFENFSNTEFVNKVKILKRNEQNNYTQHTNGCDSQPSTSRPTSSTSSQKNSSPKFVERRSCFKCGEFGHIIKDCANPPKTKFVDKAPPEKVEQSRSVSPKQDKRHVKEQEAKQKRKNHKVLEKALKTEDNDRISNTSYVIKP